MTSYSDIFERIQYNKRIKIVNGTAIRDMMYYAGVERPSQWARFLGTEGLNKLSSTLLSYARSNTTGGTIPFSGKRMSGTGALSRSLILRRGGLTGYLRAAAGKGVEAGVVNYRGSANVTLGIQRGLVGESGEDPYNYGRILDHGGWVTPKPPNKYLTIPIGENRNSYGRKVKSAREFTKGETFTLISKLNAEEKIIYKKSVSWKNKRVPSPGKRGKYETAPRRVYSVAPIFLLRKREYVPATFWAYDAMLRSTGTMLSWLATHAPPANFKSSKR